MSAAMRRYLLRPVSRLLLRHYIPRLLPDPPVFIGGAPRSGTTLLISILGSHSRVHAIDYETTAFHPVFQPEKLAAALLLKPGNRRRNWIAPEKTRYCEKTPGNIRHVDEIVAFYAGRVRCINIVRDGRDVVTSRHPEDPGRYWVPIRRWTEDAEFGLAAQRRGQVLTVRYEDLVERPESTIRGICDYLDLSFESAMLEYQNVVGSISSMARMAWDRDAQAINTRSLRKWEKHEHQQRMAEFYASEDAVRLLHELGYE